MPYDAPAPRETLENLIPKLAERGVVAEIVKDRTEALAKIKELIPAGASVMNGSSVTLEEIGYIDLLKSSTHPWKNLKTDILAETDPGKQATLRKYSVVSDYYLGSVHALAEDGQFVIASNTGSQLPHIVYTSPNLIFVVGNQKVVPDLATAFKRIEGYVLPLENKHMMDLYKVGSQISKIVVWRNEAAFNKRTVRMLLVEEKLGF
jgi:hypothetical protein